MKKRLFTILCISFLTCLFLSCNHNAKKDDVPEETITGDLEGLQEFKAGTTIYINHEVYIQNNATVIFSGCIVKFGPEGSLTVKNMAELIAYDTVFTSINDDTQGDIIKSSNGTPKPNDWSGIVLNGGIGEFKDCSFKYGGKQYKKSGHYSVLYSGRQKDSGDVFFSKMKIESCSFEYNGGIDAPVGGTAAVTFGKDSAYYSDDNCIEECTFRENIWPLSIPTDFCLRTSENKFIDNKYQGIYVEYDNERKIGHANNTFAEWEYQPVPYCYMHEGYDLEIKGGGTLSIKGGLSADKPTKILVNKMGIKISSANGKQSTLKLGDNITFDSYYPNVEWDGIFSWTGSQYEHLYTTNTEKNVKVLNYDGRGGTSAEINSENH